ncbi:Thioredoxin reductase [Candidatus Syntrophocurvum alkaliphilum]|uniref:Thioredoxin reductase n=1 Tax=Candidatus Syntrophocurvum alkaliphilum TaxID=2293317 RepID=A0A6I6DKV3_9FIRM|nr:thioredoxin-disulfide reductase [Candidatus Syntrophocurvum alkaliphilum]QGT99891.1 Thioredoxin reductase [Candidatus Syntrophocurvum alkaliphilum]
MENFYDLLILGGGPAGLAAGVYGARARMKTAILEKGKPGGQAATTEELENYPGFGKGTTGPGLSEEIAKHAKEFGAEFIQDNIEFVDLNSTPKKVVGKKKEYYAKSIVYALGAEPRLLKVEGEGKFRGKGVSYCATCDADFFEELEVVVVGSGDAAIEEAEYLSKFADKVTMIVIHEEGKVDANKVSAERAFKNPKLNWLWNSTVQSINGDEIVESITVKNIKTGEVQDYPAHGVFIFIGIKPTSDLVKDQLELNEQGYIITDERMRTNIEGVFAAGDVREKYLRQVITAASDGATAAFAAEKYVHETEIWEKEVLKVKKPVIVTFYNPTDLKGTEKIGIVDNFIKENERFALVKVDATRNELIKTRYDIDSKKLPTIWLFKDGAKVDEIKSLTYEELEKLNKQH